MGKRVTKYDLLETYGMGKPKLFIHFDGFTTWPIKPGTEDANGHELWRGETYELIGSQVRVLVEPMASEDDVVAMLRKIANWIERDGINRPTP